MPRDDSLVLSDVRGPTLAIVRERRGRYNVERIALRRRCILHQLFAHSCAGQCSSAETQRVRCSSREESGRKRGRADRSARGAIVGQRRGPCLTSEHGLGTRGDGQAPRSCRSGPTL
jgi:hypothetical protein